MGQRELTVKTKGARSLLTPILDLKLPRMWPKSMWKKCPDRVTIRLSLCLSPRPNRSTRLGYSEMVESDKAG